ncbi:MAG: hypothetical protein KGH61_03555 [Candidatus Micrarchaeota archaeon]|nr:hypothetical protein [Candidatus Micrarchaeota archaeon]MDE1847999.1 hypothetical protein [Candidatus Micrarchaeota archaeon]MDE1864703.1 hypothetical protein [Candidatus Micrarchaeota archaeon]
MAPRYNFRNDPPKLYEAFLGLNRLPVRNYFTVAYRGLNLNEMVSAFKKLKRPRLHANEKKSALTQLADALARGKIPRVVAGVDLVVAPFVGLTTLLSLATREAVEQAFSVLNQLIMRIVSVINQTYPNLPGPTTVSATTQLPDPTIPALVLGTLVGFVIILRQHSNKRGNSGTHTSSYRRSPSSGGAAPSTSNFNSSISKDFEKNQEWWANYAEDSRRESQEGVKRGDGPIYS